MLLIFVHGWSATKTDTYGGLPEAVVAQAADQGIAITIAEVFLSRYISFRDEVTLDDISRAFDYALRHDVPEFADGIGAFACLTHSTGGPVVRNWIDLFYGQGDALETCPLTHLIMLAPPNHGSALATIGKSRIGRLKAWYYGIEPGQRVLDWLCLGSEGQWALNTRWRGYAFTETAPYLFVLAGDTIDTQFYDFLNSYLVEAGSDGVIRLAGANMNYNHFRLIQGDQPVAPGSSALALVPVQDGTIHSPSTPFAVVSQASHIGDKFGIMESVTPDNRKEKPVVAMIFACLAVASRADHAALTDRFLQDHRPANGNFTMFVLRVRDDRGDVIGDYDLVLLGGPQFQPDQLPKGFFKDRQKNNASQSLVYYLNYDMMCAEAALGFRVVARPDQGFARYAPVEYRIDGDDIKYLIRPNETVYLDVVLKRIVDRETFRLETIPPTTPDFRTVAPGGTAIDV